MPSKEVGGAVEERKTPAGAIPAHRPGLAIGRASSIGREIASRAKPYAPALVASGLLGAVCVRAIFTRAGEPALPLDDAFIHLQYARRLAEGSFFSYVEGEGYTTGATSLLWPILLAPFYAIGLRGLSLIYGAWALGTLAHAAVAVETARAARPLAGREAAIAAGAMCIAFGAFAWFAWSGMETIALAWILMRAARTAGAWCDDESTPKTRSRAAELVALGIAAPLLRPEGAIASLIIAVALGLRPPRPGARPRLLALAPLAGPLLAPLLHLAFTGSPTTATATVKWLALNPYYDGASFGRAVLDNVQLLLTNLLDGGDFTILFLPQGSSAAILLGFGALLLAGRKRGAPMLTVFIALVGLATLLPCTYLSLLWNRVRYIWPFAGAWFVMLACLARAIGDTARRFRPSITFVTPLVAGVFVGALAVHLPWAVRDLAQSAYAIDRQQVALGRWASANLPQQARVGVNDTGAIAYLGGRATFDVVGLTTPGEARYWVAGAGSRFEHYEKMPRAELPTHFIVYTHWMACPAVLGRVLIEATVDDQTILGGPTMTVYEARYDALGTGEKPIAKGLGDGALLDVIDVSDLESEAAHAYSLDGAIEHDNQAVLLAPPATSDDPADRLDEAVPRLIADGGRFGRARDRFTASLPGDSAARLVMRVAADEPTTLHVSLDGVAAGSVEIPAGPWVERALILPRARASGRAVIEIATRGEARFRSFHYWLYVP